MLVDNKASLFLLVEISGSDSRPTAPSMNLVGIGRLITESEATSYLGKQSMVATTHEDIENEHLNKRKSPALEEMELLERDIKKSSSSNSKAAQ